MEHNKRYVIYISIVMLILLIPFVGMIFQPAQATNKEKQELNPLPKLFKEGGALNVNILSDTGDYFQHHFALRTDMVMANSALKNVTVGSGAQDQVIIGREGWLFYKGTINDYLGKGLLSDRELYAVAHNISLIQKYVEQNGSKFLFTVAPNKNSLYGKYMPYNYMPASQSNIQNLQPLLLKADIPYADLFELFREEEDELYFKMDSHWNNIGAVMVYNTIMDALEKPYESYEGVSFFERIDHVGDLDEMLYLLPQAKEPQYYSDRQSTFKYGNDVKNNMDSWIETINDEKTECLLMYRDSFGESLLPLFAEEFEQAYFSRLVPYDFTDVQTYEPDYVILQIVERNLIDFVARAAIVPGQEVDRINTTAIETSSTIKTKMDGSYLVVKGEVDTKFLRKQSDIFVCVTSEQTGESHTYKTMYLSNKQRTGNGYCLYLDGQSLPQGELSLQLIVSDNNGEYIIQSENIINEWESNDE